MRRSWYSGPWDHTGLRKSENGVGNSKRLVSREENMHLRDGAPWTIPVTLDVPEDLVANVMKADQLILNNCLNEDVAMLMIEDVYKVDYEKDLVKVFGIDDIEQYDRKLIKKNALNKYSKDKYLDRLRKIYNNV